MADLDCNRIRTRPSQPVSILPVTRCRYTRFCTAWNHKPEATRHCWVRQLQRPCQLRSSKKSWLGTFCIPSTRYTRVAGSTVRRSSKTSLSMTSSRLFVTWSSTAVTTVQTSKTAWYVTNSLWCCRMTSSLTSCVAVRDSVREALCQACLHEDAEKERPSCASAASENTIPENLNVDATRCKIATNQSTHYHGKSE